jgi:glycosyltransferase involved in cell wall biosynthesis
MVVKKILKKTLKFYKDRPIDISKQKIKGNPQTLKLIGFVKCFNEGNNGNLARCLSHLSTFCDEIVLCDDSSTDNSIEIAKKYTSYIIQMPNDFRNELLHKQKLLDLALSLDPDWIVFLDPDEVFDRSGENGEIRNLCQYGEEHEIDAFSFLYYNLWKGKENYRTDELWNKNWQPKLWKNTGNLRFELKEGLHLHQYPLGLTTIKKTMIKLIHYGFSTTDAINNKYSTYEHLGQSGWALQRIRNEEKITLQKFSKDWFPMSALKISVICLIYKSIEYTNFVLQSFSKHTNGIGKNVNFVFVANDPTDNLIDHLDKKNIPHLIFRNPDPSEYYINRVYRAWNYGGSNAEGDIIVFVNSDMAFSKGWLANLLKSLTENKIVTSRLVESGKLKSGKYGIEKDFGRTYSQFDDIEFQKFAKQISSNQLKNGGLFMPCAIYKDIFIKSGGYPIGNRVEKDGKIIPGDQILFYDRLLPLKVKHYTVFDSIVYHIQEGEMDS